MMGKDSGQDGDEERRDVMDRERAWQHGHGHAGLQRDCSGGT